MITTLVALVHKQRILNMSQSVNWLILMNGGGGDGVDVCKGLVSITSNNNKNLEQKIMFLKKNLFFPGLGSRTKPNTHKQHSKQFWTSLLWFVGKRSTRWLKVALWRGVLLAEMSKVNQKVQLFSGRRVCGGWEQMRGARIVVDDGLGMSNSRTRIVEKKPRKIQKGKTQSNGLRWH